VVRLYQGTVVRLYHGIVVHFPAQEPFDQDPFPDQEPFFQGQDVMLGLTVGMVGSFV
jgi:hypothetical protein